MIHYRCFIKKIYINLGKYILVGCENFDIIFQFPSLFPNICALGTFDRAGRPEINFLLVVLQHSCWENIQTAAGRRFFFCTFIWYYLLDPQLCHPPRRLRSNYLLLCTIIDFLLTSFLVYCTFRWTGTVTMVLKYTVLSYSLLPPIIPVPPLPVLLSHFFACVSSYGSHVTVTSYPGALTVHSCLAGETAGWPQQIERWWGLKRKDFFWLLVCVLFKTSSLTIKGGGMDLIYFVELSFLGLIPPFPPPSIKVSRSS